MSQVSQWKESRLRLWKKRVRGYLAKMKHYLRRENRGKKNELLIYNEKTFSIRAI